MTLPPILQPGHALPKATLLALCLGVVGVVGGCVERTIRVTSEPAGARVWLNDRDIGVTPTEATFTYHGVYDVRLEKPGYLPVHEPRKAKAPIYEWPGLDLIAEAIPARIENSHEWHFELEPDAELGLSPDEADAALIERANELRRQATPEDTDTN